MPFSLVERAGYSKELFGLRRKANRFPEKPLWKRIFKN